MAEIHNTTAEQLPVDLIHSEILPRLPAASIARFKGVCKQWYSFLSTHDFLKMHRPHARRRILVLDQPPDSTCLSYDCEYPDKSCSICPIPFIKSDRRPSNVLILGSLDGLLCACMRNTRELVLWNPLTRAYKKLSKPKSHGFYGSGDAVGLYIDSSNDYKILHIKRRRGCISAYVYSRGLDSWRNVKFLKKASRVFMLEWSLATFSGKRLYFTVKENWSGGKSWIVSFDVDSEEFSELRFPPLPNGVISYYGKLMEIENRIHLCVSYGMETNVLLHLKLGIWRLMEGGDRWMKVSTCSDVEITSPTMSILKRQRIWFVLRGWSEVICVFNEKSSEDKKVCLCHASWFFRLHDTAIYIESPVSPNP